MVPAPRHRPTAPKIAPKWVHAVAASSSRRPRAASTSSTIAPAAARAAAAVRVLASTSGRPGSRPGVGHSATRRPAHVVEATRAARSAGRNEAWSCGCGPGEDVLQQRHVGDAASHRAVGAVGVGVERRQPGDAAERRLEADQPAQRRRDPDRAADVGTGGEDGLPGRERGTRAAGRAAGGEVGVPRVAGHPPQRAVGERSARELGGRRPAVDDRARLEDPSHDRVRDVRDPPFSRSEPSSRVRPAIGCSSLSSERDALQRARRAVSAGRSAPPSRGPRRTPRRPAARSAR